MKAATPRPHAPFRRSAPARTSGFHPPPTGKPFSGKTTNKATSVGSTAPKTSAVAHRAPSSRLGLFPEKDPPQAAPEREGDDRGDAER